MKTIMIAGNIGKTAELREAGGTSVAGFSVAVEGREKGQKTTTWFDCSIWGKRAEVLAQYLTKGSKVAISGELGTREYNDKTYLTVNVSEVTLMGGGQDRREEGNQSSGGQSSNRDLDDEIPF